MRTQWKWALGIATVSVMGAVAVAQQLSPSGLSGPESWTCSAGFQGPSFFCTTNLMRNTTGYQLQTATTGTLTASVNAVRNIFTAALTGSVTLNTPPAPLDGEMLEIVNGTGLAFTQTITLTASAGQTVNSGAVATLAAGASGEWQYSASTTTWYRLR